MHAFRIHKSYQQINFFLNDSGILSYCAVFKHIFLEGTILETYDVWRKVFLILHTVSWLKTTTTKLVGVCKADHSNKTILSVADTKITPTATSTTTSTISISTTTACFMWLRWFDQYCQYTGILNIVRRVYHMQQVFFCYCCLTLSIEIDRRCCELKLGDCSEGSLI